MKGTPVTHRSAFFAALAIGAGVVLIPATAASAHTATAQITDQRCAPSGAFTGILSVTPTDLDKAPVATIVSSAAGGYSPTTPWPYHTLVTTMSGYSTSYTVSILWNDGVTWGPTKLTLNPDKVACTPTSTVPSTQPPTTVATTIPATTEPPTTVPDTEPPTTVPATTPTTICAQPVTLEDGSQVCNETYHAPPNTPPTNPPVAGHSTDIPNQLPATGSGVAKAVGLGVFLLLCGLIICLWSRSENRRLRKMNEDVMRRAEER